MLALVLSAVNARVEMLGISARRSMDETMAKHDAAIQVAPRWQTPPPPSPCILHLPKPYPTRTRKRYSNSSFRGQQQGKGKGKARGKLVALFGEEREFAGSVPMVVVHSPRRPKVLLPDSAWGDNGKGQAEDWKFEAEVLRAECNLLRMEKEVAVRRWEEASSQMQYALSMTHSLHSALQTLLTGRKKIVDERNAQVVLQTTLEKQIEALQSKSDSTYLNKRTNFDRQAVFLRRRLGKSPQYIQDTQHRLEHLVLAASDYSTVLYEWIYYLTTLESDREENPDEVHAEIKTKRSSPSFLGDQPNRLEDAALLKKRLDFLSMGMKESKVAAAQIRKEYKHMLSRSGDCSSRRSDAPERAEGGSQCCQLCKATIRKIAAQVQAETEQWSQVQEILQHVRQEMEELHKSRDLWEDRALEADAKIATLQDEVHAWKDKAHTYSNNVSELQFEISRLRNEIVQVRHRHALEQSRWLCLHSDSESETKHMPRIRASKFLQKPRPADSRRRVECRQFKENLAPHKRKDQEAAPKSCMPPPVALADIANTNASQQP